MKSKLAEQIASLPYEVHYELMRRCMTYRELSAESGVAVNTCYRVINDHALDVRMSTLVKLAEWLESSKPAL